MGPYPLCRPPCNCVWTDGAAEVPEGPLAGAALTKLQHIANCHEMAPIISESPGLGRALVQHLFALIRINAQESSNEHLHHA